MSDWQVTAVTISCPNVAEEVTIAIKSELVCTDAPVLKNTRRSRRARLALVDRSLTIKRVLECKNVDCNQITEYIQKLQTEENHKTESAGDKK